MKLLTSIWLLWLLRQQHPRLRSGPRYCVTLGEHHRGDKARNPSRRPSYPMLNGYAAYLKYLLPIFRCSRKSSSLHFKEDPSIGVVVAPVRDVRLLWAVPLRHTRASLVFLRVNILLALKAPACLKRPAFLDLSWPLSTSICLYSSTA
jgi:hypothetical protein